MRHELFTKNSIGGHIEDTAISIFRSFRYLVGFNYSIHEARMHLSIGRDINRLFLERIGIKIARRFLLIFMLKTCKKMT